MTQVPAPLRTSPGRELVPLTSLRFIAAFGVVLHHLHSWHFLGPDFYEIGGACVTFFFVLSGFILVYSYAERFRSRSWLDATRHFYRARIARIYPVYFVTLVFAALTLVGIIARPGVELRREAVLHGLMLQPWFSNPDIHFGFNGPGWTIGVEMFFYLLFPFMLAALLPHAAASPRRYARWLGGLWLAAVVPLAVNSGLRLELPGEWLFYVFPPYRVIDFGTGVVLGLFFLEYRAMVAEWFTARRATIVEVALVAITLAAVLVRPRVGQTWMHPVDLAIGAAVVLTAAAGAGIVSAALRWRAPRYLGRISFSLYMIHYVVMEALVLRLHVDVTARYWPWIIIVISLTASDLLFQLVEEPARRRFANLSARPGRAGTTATPVH